MLVGELLPYVERADVAGLGWYKPAGHADLGTTERYVEPSLEAQRRLIALT